jgi:small GTP-binding protein
MNNSTEDTIINPSEEPASEEKEPQLEEALKKINECKIKQSAELDLSKLNLRQLPDQIYELNFLERLISRDNPLEYLHESIGYLKSLKYMDIADVKFSELPQSFSNLTDLEYLTLSGKQIEKFPEQLLSLHKLISIDLTDCKITELPEELDRLENLETLWLLRNPISKIDHLPNLLSNLIQLSVHHTEINNYDFLEKLIKIQNLSMGNSNLKELPKQLFNLKTLSRLHVSSTSIQFIPNEIKKLVNLKELLIFDFKIKNIPNSIGNLIKLERLSIISSGLETIPVTIGDLHKLRHLQLYRNSLKEIPAEIGKLSNLIKFDLHKNELNSLPSELSNLKNLEELNLSTNNLVAIPPELSRLSNLKKFSLRNNDSLTSPPKHVQEKGTEAILGYLNDLIEEVKVWSSKLVIVGEGQVGKSCLLDALEGKPFEKGKSTTHALNRSQLNFEHPEHNCTMQLNVWDFGGQDIYHATHQFYLTNHSLFLLVWSARAGYEAGKIYKWLETISALAPDSPIFIVATNSDERGADLPKGDIVNQYPNKISFFEVDNEKRTGIDELKEAIRQKSAELKYMGIGRPRSWMNSLQEIKQTEEHYLSKSKLLNIFYRNGVSKESYESLATYLHDLGEILYYPDEEELNDTIIIKPEWVSKQIAKILDSEKLSINDSFLDKKLLQELWSDLDGSMQEKLITLMEKFDLSYKTKDDKEISLIVEKLKYEEHENYQKIWANFISKNEIVFKYELDTIPAGIPTWFIARTHRFSMKVHWRFGVLLKDADEKHLGLLISSPERKEIWLRVKGEMPYYFFAQLRDTLELTFNRFEGLKRPAFVPCPGHHGNPCPHLFELKQLEKRLSIEKPKQTIECPESLEDVNVMKLIFGISFAPNNEILVERIRGEIEKIIRRENRLQTDELIKFTQLEFIKSYQCAQEIADITCPNIFTLKRIESVMKEFDLTYQYKLQLYCQMPGCNHSIGEPYNINIPKDWIIAIGPYYNKMLKILKYTLPLAMPGVKTIIDDADFDVVKPYVDSVKEYSKIFHDVKSEFIESIKSSYTPEEPIRNIRLLLDSVDANHNWAGLRRLVSPEGHILWLCKEHFAEYKN